MKPQCTPVWGSCTLESGHRGQHSQHGPYTKRVAALYVAKNGCYFGLPDVDPWDEERDARKYAGPHPVVAHPPCERWGRYWYGGPTAHKLGKRRLLGDDGGCFAAALESVKRYGGVLEHPAASHAWRRFGITAPHHTGGWVPIGDGGWTCHVDQGHFGHLAKKPTWLLAFGVDPPSLPWGKSKASMRIDAGFHSTAERRIAAAAGLLPKLLTKTARIATPLPFRDLLLSIARSARAP